MHGIPKTRAEVRPARRAECLGLAVLAAAGAGAGAACRGEDRAPPPRWHGAGLPGPRRGGTLTLSIVDEVRTLDPAIAYDEYSAIPEHLLYETLLDYAPAAAADPLALEPALAESYTVSPDGLSYSFNLRPDLAYHDGEPIVAEDFVYALERVLDPRTASPGRQYYLGIAGAEAFAGRRAEHVSGLRALDARHLEIRLEAPDTVFPLLLTLPFSTPLKPSWVAARGDRMVDTPLASGPFRLAELRPSERLVLVRNPRYWNPQLPYLDRIVVTMGVPRTRAALELLAGELDAVDRLNADDYLRFAATPAWQPYLRRTVQINSFGEQMNLRHKPFDDRRVRQALNYGIDKHDTWVLENGRVILARGLLPPSLPGYDPALAPYPYDPERAQKLLAEAGYPDGFDVTYTATDDETAQLLAQSIQADLAKLKIRVHLRFLTAAAYFSAIGRGELPFSFSAWNLDFPDPYDFLYSKFHSDGIAAENASNETGYRNPEFDRLVAGARHELDAAKRLDMYRRAERILHEDCPWVWHYHQVMVEVVQPYVRGYQPHPVWLRDFRRTWLDGPRRPGPPP
jgi:peptide/nickel transport system substrate-binding protein